MSTLQHDEKRQQERDRIGKGQEPGMALIVDILAERPIKGFARVDHDGQAAARAGFAFP